MIGNCPANNSRLKGHVSLCPGSNYQFYGCGALGFPHYVQPKRYDLKEWATHVVY